MKSISLKVLALAVMIFMANSSFSAHKDNAADDRVLVLGFKSSCLDDVQERIFRETLMRRLKLRGYNLVPVMDVESLVHDGTSLDIRNIQPSQLQAICSSLKAGYALTGSIEVVSPLTTLPDREQKKMCRCEITIYDVKKDSTSSYKDFADYHELLENLFMGVSEKISEIFEKSGTVRKK